jgi:FAD/FMN-containing dehydrogenase
VTRKDECSAPPISAEAIERLKAAVGRAGYLDDPADMAPYCTSWRDNWVGRVPLVLRPQSTQEVAAIVQICAEQASPSSRRAATPG